MLKACVIVNQERTHRASEETHLVNKIWARNYFFAGLTKKKLLHNCFNLIH